MKKQSSWSVILGCTALTLALGRCSPIAPSLDKSAFQQASPNLPSAVGPSQTIANTVVSVPVQTRIVDADSEPGASEATPTLVLSADDSPSAFQDFQTTGKAQITLDPSPVTATDVLVILPLNLSADQISAAQLGAFQLTISPIDGNTWQLGIQPGSSNEVIQTVLQNLAEVTIYTQGQQIQDAHAVGGSISILAVAATGPSGPTATAQAQTGQTGVTGLIGQTGATGKR
jgi:hypothetical protein